MPTLAEKAHRLSSLKDEAVSLIQGITAEVSAIAASLNLNGAVVPLPAVARRQIRQPKGPKMPPAKARAGGRKARTIVTPDIREKIIKLAKKGIVGHEIAGAVHVSEATVNNVKKEAGLVKKREKAAA